MARTEHGGGSPRAPRARAQASTPAARSASWCGAPDHGGVEAFKRRSNVDLHHLDIAESRAREELGEHLGPAGGESHSFVQRRRAGLDLDGHLPEVPDELHPFRVIPDIGGLRPVPTVTRAISRSAAFWSATKFRTRPETTTSTVASPSGILVASPRWSAMAAGRRSRAVRRKPSDGSTPARADGEERSQMVAQSAPVPQPTSSHRRPGGILSQERKRGATRRLQRPMYRS